MGVSSKPTSKKPFRSITLPPTSHPSSHRIEKVLNKFKTWELTSSSSKPSTQIICSGLSQLTELYKCFDDLLKTSLIQMSAISSNQNVKWADALLDGSVKFLDICSNTSEVVSHSKNHVRDLQYDLRRKGVSSIEGIITKHGVFRNKLKKDIQGMVASLKKVDNMISGCPMVADSKNCHLMTVIRVFTEVKALSIVIFQLVMVFFAVPFFKTKPPGRWTAISKFLSKAKVVPEEKLDTNSNELQCLDVALLRYRTSNGQEFIHTLQNKLEALDATLEGIDSGLEVMSRRLIATRASLLNMVSFY